MSTTIYLATPDDAAKLQSLVTAFHEEHAIETDAAHRASALAPLLEGSPHAAVYMIGPRVSPVGYMIVCFGWSVELGGLDGYLDEFYVRPKVRGRGMGREALSQLHSVMARAGVRSLALEVDSQDARAQRLYRGLGYTARDRYHLMQRVL